jgi:hypothetical protein
VYGGSDGHCGPKCRFAIAGFIKEQTITFGRMNKGKMGGHLERAPSRLRQVQALAVVINSTKQDGLSSICFTKQLGRPNRTVNTRWTSLSSCLTNYARRSSALLI